MWLADWMVLSKIAVTGLSVFIGLVFILRVAGKRTLARMNAFDFIMTYALGSTLATTIVNVDTSVAEGVTALGVLIVAQYVIAWLEVRSDRFQSLVKSKPSLVLYDGEMQRDAMKKERLSEVEIYAALRSGGLSAPSQAMAVILETNGQLSVIARSEENQDMMALTKGGIHLPEQPPAHR